jgi:hypothetical protein
MKPLKKTALHAALAALLSAAILGPVPGATAAPPAANKPLFNANQTGPAVPSLLSGALRMNGSALSEVKPEADKVAIRLSLDALDREFMLQAAYTEFEETPKFHGLKSRIVTFKKHRGKLYMIEASAGNTASTDMPTTLLLAEFPILEESGGWIEIDWGAGMKNVFLTEDMQASDIAGPEAGPPALKTLNIRFAFVDSAQVTSDNQIIIRQIAQLDLPGEKMLGVAPTVEVKYYLTAYQPDATFKPTVSKGFRTMGFFEVAPQMIQQGGQVIYAAHFNQNKPIVFAVSANTPAEYRQAIKDGVLYWNKVLGENRLQVVDAPAGIVPPDFNLNIIQWVGYEQSGAAYADAQMDPRTGEVLHAQIYLPSSFAIHGKDMVRSAMLRAQAATVGAAPKASARNLRMHGHGTGDLCNMDLGEMSAHSIAGMDALLRADVPDSKLQKASQDTIRAVVAHEVGHTLGLRHNFAGSLASTMSRDDVEKAFAGYLQGKPTSKLPSSTVMDYLENREMILLGDLIGRGQLALDYDKKAMGALYQGKDTPVGEMPLFCTDSSAGKYLDCQRFDSGRSIVEARTASVVLKSEQVAHAVLELAVALTKTPPRGQQPLPIERLSFDPQQLARFVLGERHLLFLALTDKAQLLGVRRGLAFEGPLTDEEAKESELAWLQKEIERAGGVAKVFEPLPPEYADKLLAHWNALLADKRFTSGKRKDGSAWAYSDAEIVQLQAFGGKLFGKVKQSLVIEDVLIFAGAIAGGKARLPDHDLSRDLAAVLEQRAIAILTTTLPGQDVVVPLEGPAAKFFSESFVDGGGGAEMPKIQGISGALGGIPTVPMTPKPGVGVAGKDGGVLGAPTPAPAPKALILPKFAYPLEVRRAAASLLSPGRCEAPEWGLGERIRVKQALGKLAQSVLAGKLPPGELRAELLPRQLVRWIIELKAVEAAIGG